MELEEVCERKKEREQGVIRTTSERSMHRLCLIFSMTACYQHSDSIKRSCSVSLTPDHCLTADRHFSHEVWADSQIDWGTEG